jgi:OHCU decarboxylase
VIALDDLNRLQSAAFTASLSGIFEHSDWIAQRAAQGRPFASRLQLLEAMRTVVNRASADEQLALIQAHPRLGARGRSRAQLTQASSREQQRAGLDACTDEQFAQLQEINGAYEVRFGFPFILAVRGHGPAFIITQLQRRVRHDRPTELKTALHQIGLIAAYRLADVVASRANAELPAMLARFSRGDRQALLIEWMRCAGLSVWDAECGALLAAKETVPPGAVTWLLGMHADDAGRLEGAADEAIEALAIVQELRTRPSMPLDLAVWAERPLRDEAADSSAPAGSPPAGSPPTGRVALERLGNASADASVVRRLLARAGRELSNVWIVTRSTGPASIPADIGRAWHEFLMHT